MTIRPATSGDLIAMVAMIEAYRIRLQEWEPRFWSKAGNSGELSELWFGILVDDENTCALISEGDSAINGFLIATLTDGPPVYDTGGKAMMIDDYCVADDTLWPTVGAALLEEAKAWGGDQGANQTIIVSPNKHDAKMKFLEGGDQTLVSTWWTQSL